MPDVPTMAEAGIPDFAYSTWYGLFAPKGTPRPIVDRVSASIEAALKKQKVQKQLEVLGAQIEVLGPDEFAEFFKHDVMKWREDLQRLKISID